MASAPGSGVGGGGDAAATTALASATHRTAGAAPPVTLTLVATMPTELRNTNVAVEADGGFIVVGGDRDFLEVHTATAAASAAADDARLPPPGKVALPHSNVWSLVAADARHVLAGIDGGTIALVDCAALTVVRIFTTPAGRIRGLLSIGESAAGPAVFVSGDDGGDVRRWHLHDVSQMAALGKHAGQVRDIVALPGERAASGSSDGSVMVWDVRSLACEVAIATPPSIYSLALVHGDRIAVGDAEGSIRFWHLPSRSLRTTVAAQPDYVGSLCLVDGGSCLVSRSYSQGLFVWDAGDGRPLGSVKPPWCLFRSAVLTGDRIAAPNDGPDGLLVYRVAWRPWLRRRVALLAWVVAVVEAMEASAVDAA